MGDLLNSPALGALGQEVPGSFFSKCFTAPLVQVMALFPVLQDITVNDMHSGRGFVPGHALLQHYAEEMSLYMPAQLWRCVSIAGQIVMIANSSLLVMGSVPVHQFDDEVIEVRDCVFELLCQLLDFRLGIQYLQRAGSKQQDSTVQ